MGRRMRPAKARLLYAILAHLRNTGVAPRMAHLAPQILTIYIGVSASAGDNGEIFETLRPGYAVLATTTPLRALEAAAPRHGRGVSILRTLGNLTSATNTMQPRINPGGETG